MINGKVLNIITHTKSTRHCAICKRRQRQC